MKRAEEDSKSSMPPADPDTPAVRKARREMTTAESANLNLQLAKEKAESMENEDEAARMAEKLMHHHRHLQKCQKRLEKAIAAASEEASQGGEAMEIGENKPEEMTCEAETAPISPKSNRTSALKAVKDRAVRLTIEAKEAEKEAAAHQEAMQASQIKADELAASTSEVVAEVEARLRAEGHVIGGEGEGEGAGRGGGERDEGEGIEGRIRTRQKEVHGKVKDLHIELETAKIRAVVREAEVEADEYEQAMLDSHEKAAQLLGEAMAAEEEVSGLLAALTDGDCDLGLVGDDGVAIQLVPGSAAALMQEQNSILRAKIEEAKELQAQNETNLAKHRQVKDAEDALTEQHDALMQELEKAKQGNVEILIELGIEPNEAAVEVETKLGLLLDGAYRADGGKQSSNEVEETKMLEKAEEEATVAATVAEANEQGNGEFGGYMDAATVSSGGDLKGKWGGVKGKVKGKEEGGGLKGKWGGVKGKVKEGGGVPAKVTNAEGDMKMNDQLAAVEVLKKEHEDYKLRSSLCNEILINVKLAVAAEESTGASTHVLAKSKWGGVKANAKQNTKQQAYEMAQKLKEEALKQDLEESKRAAEVLQLELADHRLRQEMSAAVLSYAKEEVKILEAQERNQPPKPESRVARARRLLTQAAKESSVNRVATKIPEAGAEPTEGVKTTAESAMSESELSEVKLDHVLNPRPDREKVKKIVESYCGQVSKMSITDGEDWCGLDANEVRTLFSYILGDTDIPLDHIDVTHCCGVSKEQIITVIYETCPKQLVEKYFKDNYQAEWRERSGAIQDDYYQDVREKANAARDHRALEASRETQHNTELAQSDARQKTISDLEERLKQAQTARKNAEGIASHITAESVSFNASSVPRNTEQRDQELVINALSEKLTRTKEYRRQAQIQTALIRRTEQAVPQMHKTLNVTSRSEDYTEDFTVGYLVDPPGSYVAARPSYASLSASRSPPPREHSPSAASQFGTFSLPQHSQFGGAALTSFSPYKKNINMLSYGSRASGESVVEPGQCMAEIDELIEKFTKERSGELVGALGPAGRPQRR